ncbi:Zinc finger protein [Granulibacter bethesdensis]|uniref:Zinc finger protein n=3 Tax=Granulibacter bethesdensis TaxID=364410 RepID=Q0BTR9_GRABC|nr:Zinc finger protein [Granulibacter bethesdensis CGDNIH1]AHJ62709.1 Zinc finger protein [Granulibacter bethesdensis]AHJ66725.1 Zinc finger protein [Granulibacter bethesdensis CGDNIH4]AHJ69392.1 Zinc finger protein [Granulibacter bethesdensis]APH51593.1 Zinc finger protein [Granulibacter bethesdensis]
MPHNGSTLSAMTERPASPATRTKVSPQAIDAEIIRLTTERGPASSICPTEVARALAPTEEWRRLLSQVRRQAARLASAGLIDVLRKGKPLPQPVTPDTMRGVLRLRVRPNPPEEPNSLTQDQEPAQGY